MKKNLKVELRTMRSQTETKGYLYQSQEWRIPFESLGNSSVPVSELEADMQVAVFAAFPDEYERAIHYKLYGDLSAGGSITHGDVTLSVVFEKIPEPVAPIV